MSENALKSIKAPNQSTLANLIKNIHQGCIKNLVVVDGEPIFNPAPSIIYKINLYSDSSLTPASNPNEKAQMLKFFEHLKSIKIGMVQVEIEQGLPVLLTYEKHLQE